MPIRSVPRRRFSVSNSNQLRKAMRETLFRRIQSLAGLKRPESHDHYNLRQALRRWIRLQEKQMDRDARPLSRIPLKLESLVFRHQKKHARLPSGYSRVKYRTATRKARYRLSPNCVGLTRRLFSTLLKPFRGRLRTLVMHGPSQSHLAALLDFGGQTYILHGHGLYEKSGTALPVDTLEGFKQDLLVAVKNPNHRLNRLAISLGLARLKDPEPYVNGPGFFVEHDARAILAGEQHNLAYVLYRLDRHAESITRYREALRLLPDFADAHNGLGEAYSRTEDYPRALKQFLQTLSLQPAHLEAHYNLVNLYQRMGDAETAEIWRKRRDALRREV